MDDIKMFAKNENERQTQIHAVRICSQVIGMEFGIEKYTMLIMKSEKRYMTVRMKLPNQEKLKRSEQRKPTHLQEYWKLTQSKK